MRRTAAVRQPLILLHGNREDQEAGPGRHRPQRHGENRRRKARPLAMLEVPTPGGIGLSASNP